ncbi:MAG: FtsW/RodA/SpoVE family cell cycle protein [Syntrophothermus sp.]
MALAMIITLLGLGLAALAGALMRGEPLPIKTVAGFGAGYVAVFLGAHLIFRWSGYSGDEALLPLVAFLSGIGMIMLYRLDGRLAFLQMIWLGIGIAAMLAVIVLLRGYRWLEQYRYLAGVAGLILLTATVVFGHQAGGARAWLAVGPVRFEPVEIGKLLLVLFLAGYLNQVKELISLTDGRFGGILIPNIRYSGPILAMWSFSMLLLVVQNDLGAALLYFGILLAMIYLSTGRASYVASGLILALGGVAAAYFLLPHIRVRVDIWLNPWAVATGKGYQTVQSLFAMGSGGIFGTGLGLGHPELIPAVETDFIFAAVGEELGLAGTLAVLLALALLIWRGFAVALSAPDDFGLLMAAGLTSVLAIQTLVITGGVTRLIPLTGITLPFISYGGSSLVTNFILIGLLGLVSGKGKADARENA